MIQRRIQIQLFIGIFALFLLGSCKQYGANVEDFFVYWSGKASITGYTVGGVTNRDADGILSATCFSHEGTRTAPNGVDIILHVQNPQLFKLVMPSAAEKRKIVSFKKLPAADQPRFGTDYTLTQTSSDTLKLTYTKNFLQRYEWGSADLDTSVTLYAEDGRKFDPPFTFQLRANTPPPTITHYTVAKTAGTAVPHYVLCLQVPHMNEIAGGKRLHGDIASIEINGTRYPCRLNNDQTDFIKPDADVFLDRTAVEPLNVEIPSVWTFYYRTDAEIKDGNAQQTYRCILRDTRGLASGECRAVTDPNKAGQINTRITKGTLVRGSGYSAADPMVIQADIDDKEARLELRSASAAAVVHTVLTDMETNVVMQYDGNPVTVRLPLHGAGEKRYKLTYHADGAGFTKTELQTAYYTVAAMHTVRFDSQGGSAVSNGYVLHGALMPEPVQPVKSSYTFVGWYKESTYITKWNFALDAVTSDLTLYAKWKNQTGIAYRVEHYQENVGGGYPASPVAQEDETGTAGQNAHYSIKNYPGFTHNPSLTQVNGEVRPTGTVQSDGRTVVKLYYERNTVTLPLNLNGGTISGTGTVQLVEGNKLRGKYGESLIPIPPNTFNKTGYTFNKWVPPLPATFPPTSGSTPHTAEWNENTYIVHFNGNGANSGTMDDQSFRYSEQKALTPNGFTKTGWAFKGWARNSGASEAEFADQALITAPLSAVHGTVVNLYAVWKEERYSVTFKVDGTHGKLKGAYSSQMLEAGATERTFNNVPHGTVITFEAVPAAPVYDAQWMSTPAVTLTPDSSNAHKKTLTVMKSTVITVSFKLIDEITGSHSEPWALLKNWVQEASAGSTLKIKGRIMATHESVNSGEISIDKALTIEGDAAGGGSADTNILDANGTAGGKPGHRIFNVVSGGSLVLKNLTLTGGQVASPLNGGALHVVSGRDVTLTDCRITNCQAVSGGGIYSEGTVSITGGSIGAVGTQAGNSAQAGGGIYVKSGFCTLTGTQLLSNRVDGNSGGNKGGGIYVETGSCTLDGVTITGNTVMDTASYKGKGSGLYLDKSGTHDPQMILKGKIWMGELSDSTANAVFVGYTGSGSTVSNARINIDNLSDQAMINLEPQDYAQQRGTTLITGSGAASRIGCFHLVGVPDDETWKLSEKAGFTDQLILKRESITVQGTNGTSDWKKLKTAIGAAEDGDVIIVKGTIKATSDAENSGEMTVARKVTVRGAHDSNGSAVIDANNNYTGSAPMGAPSHHRIFKVSGVDAHLTLENLILQHGKVELAGAGGAVHVESGQCTIIGSTIQDNSANRGGGIYNNGICTIENSKIYRNTAKIGAGLYIENMCTLKGATAIGDKTDNATTPPTKYGNFTPAATEARGGGIFVHHKGSCQIEKHVRIIENHAVPNHSVGGYGGGIYIDASGGDQGTVTISGTLAEPVVISDNEGNDGGAIYTKGQLNITYAELKNNIVENNCGGIYIKSGSVILSDTTVSANSSLNSSSKGSGIYVNDGSFTMKGSSVVTPATDKNDVYLGIGRTIHINGDLTSSGKAARITPQSYPSGSTAVKVLSGDITTGSNYDKFTVTPSSGMQQWRVDSNGKLVSQ